MPRRGGSSHARPRNFTKKWRNHANYRKQGTAITHLAAPGDTIRITAEDVTLLDGTLTRQSVTSGLTGTITLVEWESGATVVGPTDILAHVDDDWYADFTAPAAGRYRIVAVIQASGAQRTLAGELKVGPPPT